MVIMQGYITLILDIIHMNSLKISSLNNLKGLYKYYLGINPIRWE
jgi:hypothetical protein